MTAKLGLFIVLIFSGNSLWASVDPCDFEAPPEARRGVLNFNDLDEDEKKDPTILQCVLKAITQIENRKTQKFRKEVIKLPKGVLARDPIILVRNCEYVKVPKKVGEEWELQSDVQKIRSRTCHNQEFCSGQAKCLMAETKMLRIEYDRAQIPVKETEILGIKKFTPTMLGYEKLKPVYRKVVCEALKNGKCPDADSCRGDLRVRTAPVSIDGEDGVLSSGGTGDPKPETGKP